MLCMISKRTIYTIPNERFIGPLTREHNAAVPVKGSFSAPWIWNTSEQLKVATLIAH